MVAYSFKGRFCEPILDGTKGGTIRANRRRNPRPGEELQLYQSMRTKHCRLIARKTCLAVEPITLQFRMPARIIVGGRVYYTGTQLATFAHFDGFIDFDEMRAFWKEQSGFVGCHIRWLPLPEVLQ